MSTSNLACDFRAIPEDEREDHTRIAESLFGAITKYEETEGGYRFQLPAQTEVIERAGEFVARERLCCPFFYFRLTVTPDQGPVWLKLTGGEDVKTYIEETVLDEWDF